MNNNGVTDKKAQGLWFFKPRPIWHAENLNKKKEAIIYFLVSLPSYSRHRSSWPTNWQRMNGQVMALEELKIRKVVDLGSGDDIGCIIIWVILYGSFFLVLNGRRVRLCHARSPFDDDANATPKNYKALDDHTDWRLDPKSCLVGFSLPVCL